MPLVAQEAPHQGASDPQRATSEEAYLLRKLFNNVWDSNGRRLQFFLNVFHEIIKCLSSTLEIIALWIQQITSFLTGMLCFGVQQDNLEDPGVLA